MKAIEASPPNVWLRGFHEFRPEQSGYLGFTLKRDRESFLKASKPGVIVVIYGTGKAAKDQQRK